MADDLKIAEETTKDLLGSLGFSNVGLEVQVEEEEGLSINIEAPPEDSGILIGFHGETITALERIISQMVYKRLGEWKRIAINIGDYREKRQKALESMAQNASQRVKLTKQPVDLPYLDSSERRFIHLILSDDPDVETASDGVGKGRRLIISLKKQETKSQKESKMDEKTK